MLDIFGGSFAMKLDDGEEYLTSFSGAILSVLSFISMMLYLYLKSDVLLNKKDVDILSTVNRLFFDDDERFTFNDGFNIAVAFTAFDNEEEWILDKKYGTLVFMDYGWGQNDDDGKFYVHRKPLETKRCTAD